jgi:anti-sigma factor RsiW
MRAEHLELYALGELGADLSTEMESHLKSCVACGLRFEESRASIGEWVALADAPPYRGPEKRVHARVDADDPAVFTVLQSEPSPRVKVRVMDVSPRGLRLLIPYQVMRGELVQLYVRDLFILAEVRNCRKAAKGFQAGLLIHDVFPAAG